MASPKRWAHVRRFRRAGVPALALLMAAAVTGCTSSSPPAVLAGPGPRAAGPALTMTQARAVFDGYAATTAKAVRTADPALALSVVTGIQRAILAAALTGPGADPCVPYGTGTGSGPFCPADFARSAYGTPVIYLPEPAGYPRFFVADAARTLTGPAPAGGFSTQISGVSVPVDGRVLMVFEQAGATTAWQLASTSIRPSGMTLPRLATDSSGYVPQVPLSTATLLARPDVIGPLQAAVVDGGPASTAGRAVAPGTLTTGLYQGAREHVNGLTTPRGDVYQWDLEGTPYPVFALRTAAGGALVLYTMDLNSTVAVPDVINKATPVRPGLPIEIPPNFLPLFPKATIAPRESLETQLALSFAAIDPPAAPAKVTVIAVGGGPDYARAS